MSGISSIVKSGIPESINYAQAATEETQATDTNASMEQILAQLIQQTETPTDTFVQGSDNSAIHGTNSYPVTSRPAAGLPQAGVDPQIVDPRIQQAMPQVLRAPNSLTTPLHTAPQTVAYGGTSPLQAGVQVPLSVSPMTPILNAHLPQGSAPNSSIPSKSGPVQNAFPKSAPTGQIDQVGIGRADVGSVDQILNQLGLVSGVEISDPVTPGQSAPQRTDGKFFSGTDYLHAIQGIASDRGTTQNGSQSDRKSPVPSLGMDQGNSAQKVDSLQLNPTAFESRLASVSPEMIQPIQLHGAPSLHQPVPAVTQRPPIEVTGHVVPGSMMRNRLSSESVIGLSSGVRSLAGNGGGEIRIRLRPDNLGELNLKVTTLGNQVGLKIQASDEGARKIIEETIGSLKEKLATQNLSLGRVEVSLATPSASRMPDLSWASGLNSGSDAFQPQQQSAGHQNQGGYWNETSNQDERMGRDASGLTRGTATPNGHPAARPDWAGTSRNRLTNGRVDMMA